MKNHTVAQSARIIPYNPIYTSITGSVTSAILFQQLEFYFSRYGDGFYKFLEPASGHDAYKEGDSWTEEIAFSKDEFRSAFDSIGIRHKSKKLFRSAVDEGRQFKRDNGEEVMYCSYHNRVNGLTYYVRNHNLVDSILSEIVKIPCKSGKSTYSKSGKSTYGNQESRFTEIEKVDLHHKTETTTETTTEREDAKSLSLKENAGRNGSSKERDDLIAAIRNGFIIACGKENMPSMIDDLFEKECRRFALQIIPAFPPVDGKERSPSGFTQLIVSLGRYYTQCLWMNDPRDSDTRPTPEYPRTLMKFFTPHKEYCEEKGKLIQ